MGIFVSFIGIAITLIIGYQILNAIEIKREIKELRKENEDIKNANKDFKDSVNKRINDFNDKILHQIKEFKEKIESEIAILRNKISDVETHSNNILAGSQESISILNSLILENKYNGSPTVYFDAFVNMHNALLSSLNYESENIDYIFHKLRAYGSTMTGHSFGSGFSIGKDGPYFCNEPFVGKSLREILDTHFLPPIKKIEEEIRKHKHFRIVSHDYNNLMRQFYERIDFFASCKDGQEFLKEKEPFR